VYREQEKIIQALRFFLHYRHYFLGHMSIDQKNRGVDATNASCVVIIYIFYFPTFSSSWKYHFTTNRIGEIPTPFLKQGKNRESTGPPDVNCSDHSNLVIIFSQMPSVNVQLYIILLSSLLSFFIEMAM